MDLTAGHWIYLLGMIVIIVVMIYRKNVVVPAVTATFVTAWVFTGSLADGLSSVFNASLVAATELFSIFLIIALITALLGALRAMGADQRMVHRSSGSCATAIWPSWIIVVVTYLISLFFWPTPAVPLIGADPAPGGDPGRPAGRWRRDRDRHRRPGHGALLRLRHPVAPGLSAASRPVPTPARSPTGRWCSRSSPVGSRCVIGYLAIRKQIVPPDGAAGPAGSESARTALVPSSRRGERSRAPSPATALDHIGCHRDRQAAEARRPDVGPPAGAPLLSFGERRRRPAPRGGAGPASSRCSCRWSSWPADGATWCWPKFIPGLPEMHRAATPRRWSAAPRPCC